MEFRGDCRDRFSPRRVAVVCAVVRFTVRRSLRRFPPSSGCPRHCATLFGSRVGACWRHTRQPQHFVRLRARPAVHGSLVVLRVLFASFLHLGLRSGLSCAEALRLCTVIRRSACAFLTRFLFCCSHTETLFQQVYGLLTDDEAVSIHGILQEALGADHCHFLSQRRAERGLRLNKPGVPTG